MFSLRVTIALMLATSAASSETEALGKKTLLQMGAKHRSKTEWGNPMLNPEYFGSFAQGESTYTYDGTLAGRKVNPELTVLDGWNPHANNPLKPEAASPDFFHESPSGAYLAAWQSDFPSLGAADENLAPNPFKTFFPALVATLQGDNVETGPWFTGTGGHWQQTYMPPAQVLAGSPAASWFDSSVHQIDGYGRQKFPGYGSPDKFVFWEQRSVNTTLTCQDAGCTANVSLTAPFDMATEEVAKCLISVFFHPTVLMEKQGEFVEWVQVNGQMVQSSCRPVAAGCNKTAQSPLQPCVYNVPLQNLMRTNSSVLTVAAKIVNSSSQCPYNGDHLSAVPMVTCLVGKKIDRPQDITMVQNTQVEKTPKSANMLQRILQKEASRGTLETLAMAGKEKDNHKLLGRLRSLLKNNRVNVSP